MRERVRNHATTAESTTDIAMISVKPHVLPVNGMPSCPGTKFMPYMEKISVGFNSGMALIVMVGSALFRLFVMIRGRGLV